MVTLHRKLLLKIIVDEKIERRMKVTERRERGRKQLLDDFQKRRCYCKLKEEALDYSQWQTRFGRGYGAVVK